MPTRPTSLPRTLSVVTLVLAALGCAEAAMAPYTPSNPVPDGLAVSFAADPRTTGPLPPPPSTTITAAGDSVVVTAILGNNCVAWSARAGVESGALIVTVVDGMPAEGRVCLAIASLGRFRAVVRPAPAGRYAVVLRERLYGPSQSPQEQELGRQSVTLR